MSTVIQFGPIVVADWSTITYAIVAALDQLGFETVGDDRGSGGGTGPNRNRG